MAFHVFVEGAVDSSPEGVERLAAAMAAQYGLPVADLRTRLARGRFRVKGNCDRETADQYARDLGRLGARCAVEDADAAPSRTSSPLLPSRASAPSNPPANYQSGLAAAFSGDVNVASLGALDDAAGALTLASVDGDEAPAPVAAAFVPPPQAAAPAAAPSRPTPSRPTPPRKPVDAFAPPDEGADLKVTLADEDVERAVAKKKASASMPPVNIPAASASVSASAMPAAAPVIAAPNPHRLGFAIGVVVAIVVGFVPAQLYASSRKASIKAEVQNKQQAADTQDAYDELDRFRTQKLGELHDARQNAAILAIILWAACGGGIAFAFRGR